MNEKGLVVKSIVIDARVVIGNHGHGILRYTEELLLHLARVSEERSADPDDACRKYRFIVLLNRDSPFRRLAWPRHFELYLMRTRWLSFLGQVELAFILRKLRPDVFHTPSFMVPLLSNCPIITTIHDLNHVVLADNYSVFHRIYYSLILSRKVRSARAVITVSQFSKSEILQYFHVDPAKVYVIYNGIGEAFQPCRLICQESNTRFRLKYELPEAYILSIGNRKPHKNIIRTVEAYCRGGFQIPLVLLTDFDPDVLEIAERYGKKHLIHFLRFVSSGEFHFVYANARAFVYPSLYEGFGFPPLEAAASGVPVVVSRKTSLPEVLQDGAIYVDPEDSDDIAAGIKRALSGTAEVDEIVSKGRAIAEGFRWSRVARETLGVYESVLRGTVVPQ
jgi:glycosyltransferase involved in cell wall biosynthesis